MYRCAASVIGKTIIRLNTRLQIEPVTLFKTCYCIGVTFICCSDLENSTLFINILLDWCLMVFNATFNNISVISERRVLLVEKTEDPEKTTDLPQVTDKHYSPWSRFELTTSVVIDTDCISSCKSNYHVITATTVPLNNI